MSKENAMRCGVCVGSGIGGIHTFLDQSLKYGAKGPSKISPFFIPMEIPNMSAGQIAIACGLKGPNTAIVPLAQPAPTALVMLCAPFNMVMPM